MTPMTQSSAPDEWPFLNNQSVVTDATPSARAGYVPIPLHHPVFINPVSQDPLRRMPPPLIQYGLNYRPPQPAQTRNLSFSNAIPSAPVLHQQPPPKFAQQVDRARSNSATSDSDQTASSSMTPREKQVNEKIIEISLTMHKSKEYVAPERVKDKLFQYFGCQTQTWKELGVHPGRLTPLNNLNNYVKTVTLYVQTLKEAFNICTLYEFEPLLVKFLKFKFSEVNCYEDIHLGPLEKHPIVQNVFNYDLSHYNQPILPVTTSDIIRHFINFRRNCRESINMNPDNFLNYLAWAYRLQSWRELGLLLRSFPYLIEISKRVEQDLEQHEKQTIEKASIDVLEDVRANLNILKEKIHAEQQLSSYTKKKTPMAVFNHLTSIIEKYFHFLPHQSAAYLALMQLRDNEFLQYLLNLSIYLGTIENSETLRTQLKQFHAEIYPNQDLFEFENRIEQEEKFRKKDRRKLRSMKRKKNKKENLSLQKSDDEDGHRSTTSVDSGRLKPSILLQELCSQIYTHLSNYQTVLTIEQLVDIDKYLCHHYKVKNFAQLNSDDIQLTHFLHQYREQIDPNQQLVIYDEQSFLDDREDIRLFVQQLNMFDSSTTVYNREAMSISVNGDLDYEHKSIDTEKWSIVDKALKRKFGQSISFRRGKSILTEASRSSTHFHKHSIVRFEESLLDIHCLNRLDICPASLNVNENQLCQLISNAPLMIDIYQWLQWLDFFQPKYGHLYSFLTKHEEDFQGILLLETSKFELVRLPFDANSQKFEQELFAMNIRSAVAHLCSLIVQEGLISRLSFTVLRTSMETWFHRLQALEILNNDSINPLRLILEFFIFLPLFIGQSRVIEELILGPMDQVFCDEPNIRSRLWSLADGKQRTKLEFWAHTININEWKNDKKWTGEIEEEPTFSIQIVNHPIPLKENDREMETVNPSIYHQQSIEKQPTIPSNKMFRPTVDDVQSFQNAMEHIESIRRDFGVDSNLNATGKYVVTKLHGVLERSLEKLSTDLYSEEGHFVLELVQNADDNHYDSVIPTLRFIVSTKRILVCNNELGFQPENINAICNVGASTKGKHKQGYTGHKGIGFKSVFMISHRPEIHSGKYHIRFDTMNGTQQIGYILPIWIDQYEESLPDSSQWRTCIRLPIKDDVRTDNFKQKFDNIQGKLLLFLNRLRQIEIIHEQDNTMITKIFSRFDHVDGQIIELQEKSSNETTHRNLWLVVKKDIPVPNDIKNKLRDMKGSVDCTTIAIAYPLEGIANSSSASLQTQPLFAYLPLRSYGFRFILQADFEIPANRQDIRRDNIWNEWLKSEMPPILFHAYEQFQRLPELLSSLNINNQQFTPFQTIKFFLKFLPSRHEVDPYFQTFINKGFQLLKGVLKFPVINPKSTKESEKISWISPSQCILVEDQFIRTVLSEDLLLAHFNSYYLHEELINECDEKLLLALGCRLLNISAVTKLMELSYRSDDQEHPQTESTIKEVAQWLICLDYSLQQQREQNSFDSSYKKKDDRFDRIKQLKIIPLQSSSHLVSLDEYQDNTIFFPLDTSKNYSQHLRLILNDVPILDNRLTNFIEDQYPRRFQSCRKLLENLGVKAIPRIQDIYRQHILPTMADPKRWSTKSNELLIAYVISIFDYLYRPEPSLSQDEINQLQKSMLIKTQENKFLSLGTEKNFVHLTRTYGARKSMESLNLPKDRVHFISDDYYLQYYQTVLRGDSDRRIFLRFLHELRIDDFLRMEYRSTPFADTAQLDGTQWQHHKDQLINLIHEPFFINDYQCEEFEILVSSEPNYDLCVQLFQYLQDHYRSTSQYYIASVVKSRHQKIGQNEQVVNIKSSFYLALRKHLWIPVTDGKLYKSEDVYCLTSSYDTFRQYVAHLDLTKVSVKDQNFIFNILGIQNTIPAKILFGLLMKWSSNLDQEQLDNLIQSTEPSDLIPCPLPSTFRRSCPESIEKIRQIYSFLIDNEETRLLLTRFRQWPLIYLPQDDNQGHFVFVHKVYWQNYVIDNALLDTNCRRAIRSYYQDNRSLLILFRDILAVEYQPNIDDYLSLLSKTDDLDQIWKLIEIIIQLTIEQKKELELQEKCCDLNFIPCVDVEYKLMKFTDRPFYPHDSDLAELFTDLVPIIKLPNFELSIDIKEKFCSLFNLPSLSEVIRIDIEVKNEQISTIITDFYRQSIDLIQIYLLENKIFSDERSKHFASIFNRMHFISVDDIQLSYSYQSTNRKLPTNSIPKSTHIDETTAKFYILKTYEEYYVCYIRAMTEFLVQDSIHQTRLSLFIESLWRTHQKDRQQGLNKIREKYTDTYEPKWKISEDEILLEEEKTEEKVEVTKEEIKAEMAKLPVGPKLPSKKPKEKVEHGNVVTDGSLQSKSTYSHTVQNHSQVSSQNQSITSNHRNDRQTIVEAQNKDPLQSTSLNVTNQVSSPPIQFEKIIISNLTDLNLSTMNANLETLSANTDEQIGCRGEELVFLLLKHHHPNDKLIWMNAEAESGKPFDIYREFSNGQKEFIEVKTTKNLNQHSFFVSVAEVKFFLQYPINSSIYRVYYADPVESSIIIKINQIEENLQRHNFKLIMTICSKPSDTTSN